MSNVVGIHRAKSFVAKPEDRYVDRATFMHHFSLSKTTVTNYVNGYFLKNGEKIKYPNGSMPHLRLPGGGLRFNLQSCADWLHGEQNPL